MSGGATNTATQTDDVGTAGAAMGAHVAALGAYSVLLGGRVRDAVLRIAARVQETRHCADGDAAVSAVRGVWRDFASGALTRGKAGSRCERPRVCGCRRAAPPKRKSAWRSPSVGWAGC
jgi:hypothetical protein